MKKELQVVLRLRDSASLKLASIRRRLLILHMLSTLENMRRDLFLIGVELNK